MVRWGRLAAILLGIALLLPLALAHKSPVIEYAKSGMWQTGYSFAPRQPVINEPITLIEQVRHLDDKIPGNVTMVFSVYQDDSYNDWYVGKQYKHPDMLLIKSAPGQPVPGKENTFTTDVVIGRPGNYLVTVDLYEDGQYIGQDMRSLDVEQRTIGPLFTTFSIVIIAAVLIGVKMRVL